MFIEQGLSKIAGSFFSGYVATASFSHSVLNYLAGTKTPLAAVFAGLLLIVLVLLPGSLAASLPDAAMAGILFLVAWGLIDILEIGHILKSSRRETSIMAITFYVVFFGTGVRHLCQCNLVSDSVSRTGLQDAHGCQIPCPTLCARRNHYANGKKTDVGLIFTIS